MVKPVHETRSAGPSSAIRVTCRLMILLYCLSLFDLHADDWLYDRAASSYII